MRKRAQWQTQLTNILRSFVHRFTKVFVILFFNYRCVWFGKLDNAGFIKWGRQHLLLIFCKNLWNWNYFSIDYLLALPWWNQVGLESLCVSCKEHRVGSCFFFPQTGKLWLMILFCCSCLFFLFLFFFGGEGEGGEASDWWVLLEYNYLNIRNSFISWTSWKDNFCYPVSLLFCLLQD